MPHRPSADACGTLLHATCVTVNGEGVLLVGPSGSGKSDLALRLLDESRNGGAAAGLVADDQVLLRREGDVLLASPPEALAGLLEVRGLGIVPVAHASVARVRLVAELKPMAEIERLPEPQTKVIRLLGIEVAKVEIDPRPASATARLRVALEFVAQAGANRQNGAFAPRIGSNSAVLALSKRAGARGDWA